LAQLPALDWELGLELVSGLGLVLGLGLVPGLVPGPVPVQRSQ
jgi:hypothetical protein